MAITNFINAFLGKFNYALIKKSYSPNFSDLDIPGEKKFIEIFNSLSHLSMTSKERMYGLYKAVEYVVQHEIDGDIVECGTWKGGSMMLAALALQHFGYTDKKLWLYDTFEGMSEPTSADFDYGGRTALSSIQGQGLASFSQMCFASLDEVKYNLQSTGYPSEKIHFVKGKVEETIPENLPRKISILRLDTDWYESTYHELKYLFPILSTGGVLIIDDYGHWKGAKDATDSYFKENRVKILLNRLDYTGRIAIKLN